MASATMRAVLLFPSSNGWMYEIRAADKTAFERGSFVALTSFTMFSTASFIWYSLSSGKYLVPIIPTGLFLIPKPTPRSSTSSFCIFSILGILSSLKLFPLSRCLFLLACSALSVHRRRGSASWCLWISLCFSHCAMSYEISFGIFIHV